MAKQLVLVDTCIWVPFFNRPQSIEKRHVDQLIDDDEVALIGPILAEILQGFKRDQQADWVASELKYLHYLNVIWDDWKLAATLGRNLAVQGKRLPLSDLVIASVALNHDCSVYTTDPQFQLVTGLRLFHPTE